MLALWELEQFRLALKAMIVTGKIPLRAVFMTACHPVHFIPDRPWFRMEASACPPTTM
jgi:hypothetical protein